ncbi:hypothetical protein [Prevotellamassilia timonensis]
MMNNNLFIYLLLYMFLVDGLTGSFVCLLEASDLGSHGLLGAAKKRYL